jgi:hypothetical protein
MSSDMSCMYIECIWPNNSGSVRVLGLGTWAPHFRNLPSLHIPAEGGRDMGNESGKGLVQGLVSWAPHFRNLPSLHIPAEGGRERGINFFSL